jgi:hypothetical protein
MSDEHPSFLALEGRHLGVTDPALEAHVAGCERCGDYLRALSAPLAPPSWLQALPAPSARRAWRPWMGLSLAFAAAAALVVAVPRARQPASETTAVREKGAPALAVHLKRGATVVVWDGHTPLREGDRVRLEVQGSGYRFVSVASASAPGAAPLVMYAGPLATSGATLLPMSFRVSGGGYQEILDVVLAPGPIAAEAHARPRAPEDGWRQRLVLPRERRP